MRRWGGWGGRERERERESAELWNTDSWKSLFVFKEKRKEKEDPTLEKRSAMNDVYNVVFLHFDLKLKTTITVRQPNEHRQ